MQSNDIFADSSLATVTLRPEFSEQSGEPDLSITIAHPYEVQLSEADQSSRGSILHDYVHGLLDDIIGASSPADATQLYATRLRHALYTAFESEPLEDGYSHPAERVIMKAFEDYPSHFTQTFLDRMILDPENLAVASQTLRCLGRIDTPGHENWRVKLVAQALRSLDIGVRDAAVQAVEHWADPGSIEILHQHSEPVGWLHEYIRDVLDDLHG